MLQELSKKNNKWLKMAFNLCQDYDYSKDLVQEMYIKIYDIHKKKPNIQIRDVYIWVVMCNIMKDKYKHNQKYRKISIESALHLAIKDNVVEFDDIETMYLNRAKEFRYLDRGLLEESYDKGLRVIQDEFNINYGFIHRTLEKTRRLILRDKYEELYNNKRLKYKK